MVFSLAPTRILAASLHAIQEFSNGRNSSAPQNARNSSIKVRTCELSPRLTADSRFRDDRREGDLVWRCGLRVYEEVWGTGDSDWWIHGLGEYKVYFWNLLKFKALIRIGVVADIVSIRCIVRDFFWSSISYFVELIVWRKSLNHGKIMIFWNFVFGV